MVFPNIRNLREDYMTIASDSYGSASYCFLRTPIHNMKQALLN